MVNMRKDVLLSIVVLCTVFLMTHLVKSDIVIKKERLKSILSDKLLRDNYLPQLISKEDENIVRKRRSELIKFIKIRNTPDESPAKKNTTQESISEPETREPVSKDYEVVSPVVDTFEEYKEDYGIFDEIKESEKLGRFIRHLTSLRKLQRRKKRAPPAPTTAVASNQPTTSTEDTTVTSVTSSDSSSTLSDDTGETQATSESGASGETEETGLSEVTEDSQETGNTGTSCTTEETEQSGESGDTQATSESGSPEDTKSTDETAQTEDTKATGQSALNPTYKAGADFLAEGKAGGTIEPSTFMIALQPYTVPDDLLGTGIGSTGTTNEDTETAGSDSTGTTNEGTETNKAAAKFRAAMPAGGSDSIGAINEDTETGGEASDVFSFMIADPNKARFDRMAYDQDSSGIANSDTAVLDGGAYDEDTSVFQDPDSSPLLRKSSRDLHLRKDDEDALLRRLEFQKKQEFQQNMNRLNQRSDTTYKINEDKETDGVASDEDSSSIEDPNIAPSDGVASDEDSSSNEDPNIARSDGVGIDKDPLFIEDQNLARSEGIVIDEDSSLIEDQNIARSEEVAIDEDSSLIEDPNIARSDKEASDEDSSLILDLDMADAIRAEERNSKSSEYLRYRKDGDIPNRPRRPAIAHVRRKDIVLTWSAPKTDDGPPAEGYMVEMRDEDGDYKVVGKPATPYLEINKLTPGNIYYFKIKSRNESGHSTPLILKYFMDDEIPAESGEDEDDVSSEEKPEAYIVGEKEGEDIKVTDTPSS